MKMLYFPPVIFLLVSLSLYGQISDIAKPPESAPIIESGRLVGTLTNTAGTLNESVMVPLFYQPIIHTDNTMSGKIVAMAAVSTNTSDTKVRILKVEDDIATVLVKNKNLPVLPPITIHYSFVNELKDMPHLTDSSPNWNSTDKVISSLEGIKNRYLKRYTEPTLTPSGPGVTPPKSEYYNNYRNIPWYHSSIEDEYQKLNVPITTEQPVGDNSSTVAVANALSYLYTKANTNPTQVSKSFLTWAHDAYPLNDNELNTVWHPNDYINPKTIIEGERYSRNRWEFAEHPHWIAGAVTYGQEHQIDLGRLLKGVQRFGVALESENPSSGAWKNPTPDTLATAKDRGDHHPLVVRCFNSWNDQNILSKCEDDKDHIIRMDTYQALFFAFVTREVVAGRPVLITYLKETSPNSNVYQKKTFVVTGSGNSTRHQSLEFLTPSGKFETYNSLGEMNPTWGEIMSPNSSNPHAALLHGEPFRSLIRRSNVPVWSNVDVADLPRQRLGQIGTPTPAKFEAYSIGFE